MRRIWFTADLHFGDENIMRYENRPFVTTEEMDDFMIQAWRMNINPQDIVYVVGDFGAKGYEADVLSRLHGTKYLIKGNHDDNTNEYYRQAGFKEVYENPIIIDGFWILSHMPLYVNEYMPYANIFGHVHTSPMYKDFSSHHYCVSYDRAGIAVDFETVKETVKSLRKA